LVINDLFIKFTLVTKSNCNNFLFKIIMKKLDKAQLKKELQTAYAELINWVNEQPIENLNKEITPNKWPISHHLYHLVKTTRAVNQGMNTPKLALRTMFGKCNRPERAKDELQTRYKSALAQNGVKAPPKYITKSNRNFEKEEIIQKFQNTVLSLASIPFSIRSSNQVHRAVWMHNGELIIPKE